MSDIFDDIKIADRLEQAAVDTLSRWWKVYARELELQRTEPQDAYPLPKAFLTAGQSDRAAADQLPCVVVISPGLSGAKPMKEGDGTYRAKFHLGIGVFVSGNDRVSTNKLIRVYAGIARMIMIQKRSLGGFACGSDWLDESYDDNFSFVDNQTIGAGQVVFEVEVDSVASRYGGPQGDPEPAPDPDTQPGSQYPLVASVTSTVGIKED